MRRAAGRLVGPPRGFADDDTMDAIGSVGVHVQAMLLEAAREGMARASQQASGGGQPAQRAEVILELSAAAQALVAQP